MHINIAAGIKRKFQMTTEITRASTANIYMQRQTHISKRVVAKRRKEFNSFVAQKLFLFAKFVRESNFYAPVCLRTSREIKKKSVIILP